MASPLNEIIRFKTKYTKRKSEKEGDESEQKRREGFGWMGGFIQITRFIAFLSKKSIGSSSSIINVSGSFYK